MIVPSAWPQVMDFFGTPLVIEPWPGQLCNDARLLPRRQFYRRIGLTRAFTQALGEPGGANLSRVLLPRASAWTSWQQNGNNIGRVNPTWLQCCWQKGGDVTVYRTSNLTVSPTCFQRNVDGRRAGLKIRSSQEGVVQVQSSVLNLARSSRRRTRPPRHTPRASGTGPTSAQRASGTGRDLLVNRPFSAPGNGRQHSPWPSAIITSPIGPLNRPLSSCASGAGRLLQRPGGCARFRRGSAAGLIALRRTSSSILAPCHRPMS
jgi:hypothetical protein